VPYGPQRPRVKRPEGGFDFFGTGAEASARKAIEAVQNQDLADVVGEEALAEAKPLPDAPRAVGKVIDLTAHDETEQMDVAELRNAVSQ
jgi:hypothetical protein